MSNGIIALGPGDEPEPTGEFDDIASRPKVKKILDNPNLSNRDKRKRILILLGLRKKKRKYKTQEAREEAARKRAEDRKQKRMGVFNVLGIAPAPRLKLTEEERKKRSKARRKSRSKRHKEFINEMIEANPKEAEELARRLGIKIKKYKL